MLVVAAPMPRGLLGDVGKFVKQTKLPFPLVLDTTRATVKAYGVHHPLGLDAINIARPSAFLIDRSGKVRFIFVSSRQKERVEIADLLRELGKLEKE